MGASGDGGGAEAAGGLEEGAASCATTPEAGGGDLCAVADGDSFGAGGAAGSGGRVCAACTWTGSQPPGAWVIFADSMPRRRGMEGPVRSMSRMPTLCPARDRESASCVVMEDLPTPPLPERT